MTESETFDAENTPQINVREYRSIVIFSGAGMSTESGVPTYRGKGGIWKEYDWTQYACQRAFEQDPEKVLRFHEKRRKAVLDCKPHAGHFALTDLQKSHRGARVVTQNIDGMHQRAGTRRVVELHGSLWRVRCEEHGVTEDFGTTYSTKRCAQCRRWLRPDITWFEDPINENAFREATALIEEVDLFICVGTSGVVWPAAGLIRFAIDAGARCIYVNPEPSGTTLDYDQIILGKAGEILPRLF